MTTTQPTSTTLTPPTAQLAIEFIQRGELRGAALLFERAAEGLDRHDVPQAAVYRFRAALIWASIGSTSRAQELARSAERGIDDPSLGNRGVAYRLTLAEHLERRGLDEAARHWRGRAGVASPELNGVDANPTPVAADVATAGAFFLARRSRLAVDHALAHRRSL